MQFGSLANVEGAIGFWACDQSDNSALAPSLGQDTSCLATEVALGAVLSPLGAVGGGQIVPRVAVVCVGGAVDGAASATAHMVFVEEDQAFDAANALVGGGIGCATAGVLDSAFNRFFRSADDVAPSTPTTRVFRAVEPEELADLQGSGQYRAGGPNAALIEGKYFWLSRSDADAYVELAGKADFGEPLCVTSGCIPNEVLEQIQVITMDGNDAVFIPEELLPFISDIDFGDLT